MDILGVVNVRRASFYRSIHATQSRKILAMNGRAVNIASVRNFGKGAKHRHGLVNHGRKAYM